MFKINKKIVIIAVAVFVLATAGLTLLRGGEEGGILEIPIFEQSETRLSADMIPIVVDETSPFYDSFKSKDRVNVLLLGVNHGMTDVIMVCSYDMENQFVNLISVPRDTFYYRPGWEANYAGNKINAIYHSEGLVPLAEAISEVLYGMPIIEDPEVAYKETRMAELVGIKKILDKYHDLVLQVRVGGTDFSSVFGVRRGVDYSLYDIMTVRECLSDIINVCGRNNDYVISGPVWEYFRAPKELMFEELPKHGLEDYLMRRKPLVNNEIDGLLREVILDKANGFIGRTVIHPTHVKFVNAMMAVTKEEYDDACQILGHTEGGVVKGSGGNKMNEIKPHTNWAKKIYNRARAYGVIKNESGYVKLFAVNE